MVSKEVVLHKHVHRDTYASISNMSDFFFLRKKKAQGRKSAAERRAPDESALPSEEIKDVERFVGYNTQQFCKTMCASGAKDKNGNKGQDRVAVNEANFKGSSEASLKRFTERRRSSSCASSGLALVRGRWGRAH